MNGNQVLFMDPYLVYYPRENRNLCVSPTTRICTCAGPAMGQLQGQSWVHFEVFPQVESCQRHPPRLSGSTGFALPRPLRLARSTWFTLRPAAVHGGSLGDVQRENLGGGVVQPVDGDGDPGDPFPPDHPPKRSLRRSAETRCSTWWTRPDMQRRERIELGVLRRDVGRLQRRTGRAANSAGVIHLRCLGGVDSRTHAFSPI